MSSSTKPKTQILDFFRSRFGSTGIISLILAVLEKLMDLNFVCPCQPVYNECLCACCCIVPFFAFWFFTFLYVDLSSKEKDGEKDKKVKCSELCTCDKIFFPTFVALFWLFLFFFDGRYVACACSKWGGKYTDAGYLQWCKPAGNETLVFEKEKETQKYVTISQFAGFGVVVAIMILIIAYINRCLVSCCSKCKNGKASQSQESKGAELTCLARNRHNDEESVVDQ